MGPASPQDSWFAYYPGASQIINGQWCRCGRRRTNRDTLKDQLLDEHHRHCTGIQCHVQWYLRYKLCYVYVTLSASPFSLSPLLHTISDTPTVFLATSNSNKGEDLSRPMDLNTVVSVDTDIANVTPISCLEDCSHTLAQRISISSSFDYSPG